MRGHIWESHDQVQEKWTNKKIVSNIFLSFGLQSIGWILASLMLGLPMHYILKSELISNVLLFVFSVLLFILFIMKIINKYSNSKYFELNPPTKAKTTYFMITDGLLLIFFNLLMMILSSYEMILIALGFSALIVISMIIIGLIANKKTYNIFVAVGVVLGILTTIGSVALLIYYFFGSFSSKSGIAGIIPNYLYIILSIVMLIGSAIGIAIKTYMIKKTDYSMLFNEKLIKSSIYFQGYQLFSMLTSIIILLVFILQYFKR